MTWWSSSSLLCWGGSLCRWMDDDMVEFFITFVLGWFFCSKWRGQLCAGGLTMTWWSSSSLLCWGGSSVVSEVDNCVQCG